MTGPLLAWIQKVTVQNFTLEVQNVFTKATTFTHIFQMLDRTTKTVFIDDKFKLQSE